jgi:hypothetical protein
MVALAACSDQPASPTKDLPILAPAPVSAAQREIAAAVQGRRTRGFEDEILRMEARAPGLGGVWQDSSGAPVIYLKDLSNRSAAMAELRSFAATMPVAVPFRSTLGVEDRTIVLQGQFAFSELVAWTHEISAHVRAPGFLSIDADEGLNRVRITISKTAPIEQFRDAIRSLGIPDSAVAFDRSSPFVLTSTFQDHVRPTGGGLQIATTSGGFCSLGYNVDVQFYAEEGFLTASHCSGYFNGFTGTTVYQATTTSGNEIGTVSINPAWNLTNSDCRGVTLCNDADAMYVHSADTSAASWSKRIYYGSAGNNNSPGSTTIISQYTGIHVLGYAWEGMTVYKVGRTTGVTYGTVASTCENPMIDSLTATPKVILCADRATGISGGHGDSGGPVYYPPVSPDPPYAIGLMLSSFATSVNSNDQCIAGCQILFSEWYNVQSHLSRYFSP